MIPKYRAFVKKENKLFETDDLLLIDFLNEEVMLQQNSIIYATSFDFDEVVLMQSTGLKDKNNKEIFEGDILGTQDGLLNGVVEYRADLGMWTNSLIRYNNFERLCNIAKSREIVGNIYENPELLEVES